MDKLADEAAPRKLAEVAEKTGCKSIAFTYNDPVIFLEAAGRPRFRKFQC
jgi:pyruvate formate lyase activating enzyme